jgi:asparagine synthase (glutamine-hydrolysing)
MCGIFGAAALTGPPLRSRERVLRMADFLRHRGPDSEGFLASGQAILGSRRLSIVDLSPEADQPFASPDGKVWLVCNGEIYNGDALRERYAGQGYPFRSSHGDVEPLLPLYLERGEEALTEIEGMFGLAIWDAGIERLLLARDRAGEKPLFFQHQDGELRFASEIQALLAADPRAPEVSGQGLSDYLTLGYCTAPRTMLNGIHKLEAGHLLLADAADTRSRPYWSAVDQVLPETHSAPEEVLEVFEQAVRRQTMSDVPIGVFTSGGLDSSLLVTSLVRHLPAKEIRTYSVQFEQASYDESDWAERVCADLGTDHEAVRAGETDLHRALELVSTRLAEPLGDPAILPTYLLSEAAAKDVKVILSGEGADELFGGYPTYLGHRWAERFRRLPGVLAGPVRAVVEALPVSTRKVSLSFLAKRFVAEAGRGPLERHLAWFGAFGPESGKIGASRESSTLPVLWERLASVESPIKRVMLFDLLTYLAENLLTKVDRATMLASVEARAPYLDRLVMEMALGQGADTAVGSTETKRALKRAALARLPKDVVYRRKRGLSVPVSDWINGGLRAEVDRLLEPERLRRQGLIDPDPVHHLLEEHRERRADHGRRLWPLLMLQRWHERWLEQDRTSQPTPVDDSGTPRIP